MIVMMPDVANSMEATKEADGESWTRHTIDAQIPMQDLVRSWAASPVNNNLTVRNTHFLFWHIAFDIPKVTHKA